MTGADSKLWVAKDVAGFLGKHINWVYAAAKCGDIPHFSVGRSIRFDPDEIKTWLQASRRKAG